MKPKKLTKGRPFASQGGHVARINELIPLAQHAADAAIQRVPRKYADQKKDKASDYQSQLWNKFFHEEMDRLTRLAGLRV